VARYETSIALSREIGARFLEVMGLENLGGAYGWMGRIPEAEQALGSAVKLAREIGEEVGLATIPESMGWLALLAGNNEAARAHLVESLAHYRPLGMRPPAFLVLAAALEARIGDRARGLAWLGLARSRGEASGNRRQVQNLVGKFLPEMEKNLPPAEVEAALARGASLDPEQVFEEIFRELARGRS
jgi:hypothetical protein